MVDVAVPGFNQFGGGPGEGGVDRYGNFVPGTDGSMWQVHDVTGKQVTGLLARTGQPILNNIVVGDQIGRYRFQVPSTAGRIIVLMPAPSPSPADVSDGYLLSTSTPLPAVMLDQVGVPGGVAQLDEAGRLPVRTIPIEAVRDDLVDDFAPASMSTDVAALREADAGFTQSIALIREQMVGLQPRSGISVSADPNNPAVVVIDTQPANSGQYAQVSTTADPNVLLFTIPAPLA